MFRLKLFSFVLLAVLVILTATAMAAGKITITGLAEVVYNKGNGLNHYYVQTDQQKYRVWTHILDPDQEAKEKMLESAAQTGAQVTVVGEISGSGQDAKVRIITLKIGK